MPRQGSRGPFRLADLAQQAVGGFLLAGPFVVTEEVWSLAAAMNLLQWGIVVAMVVLIGAGALYGADDERDLEEEAQASPIGVPVRFVSLMLVAYGSVTLLALSFSAPLVFEAGPATTAKAVSIGAIFSVVGASTADSLF